MTALPRPTATMAVMDAIYAEHLDAAQRLELQIEELLADLRDCNDWREQAVTIRLTSARNEQARHIAQAANALRTVERLLAVCGMGFTVLFSLVGVFTYTNFYLARAPFHLSPAALGSIFFVYLLGCVVTPLAGRFLDQHNFRRTVLCSVGLNLAGLLLTLVPSLPAVIAGLAVFSTGVFISQSAATVLTGRVAKTARSAAAGLYVTFYYTGGSLGTVVTGWFWLAGGWPACVGLFAGVCLVTLALGLVCGHPLPDEKPASPVVDIAG